MICDTVDISHTAAKMWRSAIMHEPHHALPLLHIPVALTDHVRGISVMVDCKLMWQNVWTYKTITKHTCTHINAEMLYSLSSNSETVSWRMLVWTLFLFWFVELVPKFMYTFQLHPVKIVKQCTDESTFPSNTIRCKIVFCFHQQALFVRSRFL
jgi:hypothetical protein